MTAIEGRFFFQSIHVLQIYLTITNPFIAQREFRHSEATNLY